MDDSDDGIVEVVGDISKVTVKCPNCSRICLLEELKRRKEEDLCDVCRSLSRQGQMEEAIIGQLMEPETSESWETTEDEILGRDD